MKKLDMMTDDMAYKNYIKLKELFPNAVTEIIDDEGNILRVIDKDILMQEINMQVVEGRQERYQFTWPDKNKTIIDSNLPTTNTLRPCREESKNFDITENLYIEGDNLEVLKILKETYLGKVKCIYIDPPYNTGEDFIFKDNFAETKKKYFEGSDIVDEFGNAFEVNPDSSGRFHTEWLNMIFPRLKISKDFLSEDGFIFVSIDDNEVVNLTKVMDEIFGRDNRLAILVWKKKYTGGKGTSTFVDYHEYILAYAKDSRKIDEISMARPEDERSKFNCVDEYFDERGKYYTRPLKSNLDPRPTLIYPIKLPNGKEVTTQWICAEDTYKKLKLEGRIEFKDPEKSKWPVYKKFYENDKDGEVKIPSFIEVSNNNEAKEELKKLFGIIQTRDLPFQTPKPTKLLDLFTENFTDNNDIILDFFSGSASTAHSVMKVNAKDGGQRKFILVQLPDKNEKRGNEFENICEIGKERIRRAGKQILEENKGREGLENLDVGFRVLKLDSSNMKDIYYTPQDTQQSMLEELTDNIKEDRSEFDLLFQVMLDLGVELSSTINEIVVSGKKVFSVADNYLLATFDKDIDDKTIIDIAKRKPVFFVMRDASLTSDSVATNFEQIFNTYSPDTTRKVI